VTDHLVCSAGDLDRRCVMKVKLTGFGLAGLVVLMLGVSSVAVAARSSVGSVAGTYTTTITSPQELKGKWVLKLAKGGTFTVALNAQTVARGKYSATATTIRFGRETGSGCVGSGTYAWKKSGKIMRFIRKREHPTCDGRAMILAHRFTQGQS
jgi:hypothetical protein